MDPKVIALVPPPRAVGLRSDERREARSFLRLKETEYRCLNALTSETSPTGASATRSNKEALEAFRDLTMADPTELELPLPPELARDTSNTRSETSAGWSLPDQKRSKLPPCLEVLETLVYSERFNAFMGCLICVNMVFMGIELDMHDSAQDSDVLFSMFPKPKLPQAALDGFEIFFFVVFGCELLLRIAVRQLACFLELSTYIDAASLTPVVLVLVMDVQAGKNLMLLRVVRLMKLARLARLIRIFKELYFLVRSIGAALKTLVWIGLLLLLTLYCASIVCTMVIGQNADFSSSNEAIQLYEQRHGVVVDVERYWGSIMRSMFTLFQIFTLDSWNAMVRPVIETHQPWMFPFFLVFIFLTSFGLLNLLMGAIVDNTMKNARKEEEERQRLLAEEYKQVIIAAGRFFNLVDKDRNGELSSREIRAFLASHDVKQMLQADMESLNLRVDYAELADIFETIALEWLEDDSSDINFEEFLGAAMKIQGSAKSRDVLATLMTSKSCLARIDNLSQDMHMLQGQLSSLSHIALEGFRGLGVDLASSHAHLAARARTPPVAPPTLGLSPKPSLVLCPSVHSLTEPSGAASPTSTRSGDSSPAVRERHVSECDLRRSASEREEKPSLLRGERLDLERQGQRYLDAVLTSLSQDAAYANSETRTVLKTYQCRGGRVSDHSSRRTASSSPRPSRRTTDEMKFAKRRSSSGDVLCTDGSGPTNSMRLSVLRSSRASSLLRAPSGEATTTLPHEVPLAVQGS